MAERRMFSKTVIDSDAFLALPHEAQLLYFHLAIQADDDGFVGNGKRICRMTEISTEAARDLIKAGFLLAFKSGVLCIAHWHVHNYIRNDRYKETIYLDDKEKLNLGEDNIYWLE